MPWKFQENPSMIQKYKCVSTIQPYDYSIRIRIDLEKIGMRINKEILINLKLDDNVIKQD